MPESRLTPLELRRFIDAEYGRLVRAVALTSGDPHIAEDAVQESLARAWQRSAQGLVIESLSRWTLTVALNHVRKAARRERTRQAYWTGLVDREETDHEDRAAALDVLDALEKLPGRQREATVLHYYLGLPLAEIAEVLGVSVGTIKTALHRARAALALRLAEYSTTEDDR